MCTRRHPRIAQCTLKRMLKCMLKRMLKPMLPQCAKNRVRHRAIPLRLHRSVLWSDDGETGKDMDTMSWQYPCPVTSVGVQSKIDNIIYDRGSDGIDGKKLTTLRMTWGQSGNRHDNASSATIRYRCLYTDGNSAGKWLKINSGNCPTASTSNNSSFYRFEYVGSKSVYNYKFVLASTYDGKDDDTTNSLCLTEMTNGLTGANYASGDHGKAYFYDQQTYAPKVVLQKCTKSTTNILGEESYPQEWNGTSHDGGGSSTVLPGSQKYKSNVTSSISYSSTKYVNASTWRW